MSAVIALTALIVAALVIDRLDATREALRTAKASCAGLVRTRLSEATSDIKEPETREGSPAAVGRSEPGADPSGSSTSS